MIKNHRLRQNYSVDYIRSECSLNFGLWVKAMIDQMLYNNNNNNN